MTERADHLDEADRLAGVESVVGEPADGDATTSVAEAAANQAGGDVPGGPAAEQEG